MNGVKRANIGCGSIRPQGWWNFDIDDSGAVFFWDVRKPLSGAHFDGFFDYAVSSFSLNELDHHELPVALRNIRQVLKPGGVLRVLVPDALRAFQAFQRIDEEWFPQDERTGGLDAKFCTFITWYGTVKSIFTLDYLTDLLIEADFTTVGRRTYGESWFLPGSGITELDSRPKEALIMEARR